MFILSCRQRTFFFYIIIGQHPKLLLNKNASLNNSFYVAVRIQPFTFTDNVFSEVLNIPIVL